MGFLKSGEPLDWESSKKHLAYVKDQGIQQFIEIYNKHKTLNTNTFVWGDVFSFWLFKLTHNKKEIEYIVLKRTDAGLKVSHKGYKAIQKFNTLFQNADFVPCKLLPEYGSFMIETTPKLPYQGNTCDLLEVEANMRVRRHLVTALLRKNEVLMTISNFPLLGTLDYCSPAAEAGGPKSESVYASDESINPGHPRFGCLTQNIRTRRNSKVSIKVPYWSKKPSDEPRFFEMDAMVFGMGCCCLQVTLQTRNMADCRFLYDQLVVLSPIFLALTASTPFHRGIISDWDVRWNVISQSVDCRNPAERGEIPIGIEEQLITKSRFSPVSHFLNLQTDEENAIYNNLNQAISKKYFEILKENGVDEQMAQHIAHLFIRDPLVIFREQLAEDGEPSCDHFENIQSTNWQTCRLKPPNPQADCGWRVEFRSMEIQLTDFENAALSVFIVLLSRAILHFRRRFYIPMDKVYVNMERSHHRDACRKEEFYFPSDSSEMRTLSIKDIVCGDDKFVGLINIVEDYLEFLKCDEMTLKRLDKYIGFVKARATGKLETTAMWMRRFIKQRRLSAGENAEDCSLGVDECNELLERMHDISMGKIYEPRLYGEFTKECQKAHNECEDIIKEAVKSNDINEMKKAFIKSIKICQNLSVCYEI